MTKLSAVLASVAFAAVSLALAPPALGAKGPCGTTKPVAVDSYVTYERVGDFAADGHVWALDSATQTMKIWQIGTNAFCVSRHDQGTFTTFAGASPEGTGVLNAGKTGTFEATIYFKVRGSFDPTLPTSGFVGAFDADCHQDGTCSGTEPHLLDAYFSRINAFGVLGFSASYVGEAGCGSWQQTSEGDTGDIVC
jgi:hypothetical protein